MIIDGICDVANRFVDMILEHTGDVGGKRGELPAISWHLTASYYRDSLGLVTAHHRPTSLSLLVQKESGAKQVGLDDKAGIPKPTAVEYLASASLATPT